ncbi:MAG: TonB family protein [Bacteroidota bacterium]|jgi:TonB family protein
MDDSLRNDRPAGVQTKMFSFLALILLFPAMSRSQENAAADSARKFISGGSYDAAIVILQEAVKHQNNSAEMYRLLGEASHRKQNLGEAVDAYLSAAAREDCDTCHQDYDSICVIFLEKKDYSSTVRYAEQARRRHSPRGEAVLALIHIIKGDSLAANQNFDDAMDEYNESLKILEDTLAYQRILSVYASQERRKELMEKAAELVKQFPAFYAPKRFLSEAYYDAGMILVTKGNPEKAIRMFTGAMEIDPLHASELSIEIADCYMSLRDTSQAFIYYGNALFDTAFSSDAALALSNIYMGRNQYEYALRTVKNSINIFPASSSCWRQLGEIYVKLGKNAESVESQKIAAKLGDDVSQKRLSINHISYDAPDVKVLPWLAEDPFDATWWEKSLSQGFPNPSDVVPVDREPVPVKQVAPEYPVPARDGGIEGTVWIRCLIDERGRVRKTIITMSESPLLNDAAAAAARRWRFTPAVFHGRPVAVWITIPFPFKLNTQIFR